MLCMLSNWSVSFSGSESMNNLFFRLSISISKNQSLWRHLNYHLWSLCILSESQIHIDSSYLNYFIRNLPGVQANNKKIENVTSFTIRWRHVDKTRISAKKEWMENSRFLRRLCVSVVKLYIFGGGGLWSNYRERNNMFSDMFSAICM